MAEGDMSLRVVVTEGGIGGGNDKGNEAQKSTAVSITKLGATIGAMSAGVGKLVDLVLKIVPITDLIESGFGGVIPALSLLAKMLGLLVRPLIDLLIPSFMLLALLLMPFVQLMNLLFRPLLIVMMGFFSKFAPLYASLFEGLYTFGEQAGEFLAQLVNALYGEGDAGTKAGLIVTALGSIAVAIVDALIKAAPQIKEALGKIWDNIKDIKIGDKTIGEWATEISTWITNAIAGLNSIWTTATGLWDYISGIFGGTGGENPISGFFKSAEIVVGQAMASVAEIILLTANFIKEKFIDGLSVDFEKYGKFLEDLFYNTVAAIVNAFIDGFVQITKVVTTAINNLIDAYNNSLGSIPGVPSMSHVSAGGVIEALNAQKWNYRESEVKGGDIIVTVNGDVSGEELVDKIQAILERRGRLTAGELGALSGLAGGS